MFCTNPPRRYFHFREYDSELLELIGKTADDSSEIIAKGLTTVYGLPNRRENQTWVQWRGYSEKTDQKTILRKRWYSCPCACKVVTCE